MNPYIKMYLISESDRRILEQCRTPAVAPIPAIASSDMDISAPIQISRKTQTVFLEDEDEHHATPKKLSIGESLGRKTTATQSTLPAVVEDEDADKTMDELHDRYRRLITLATPSAVGTPLVATPSIVKATPFVLPPPTLGQQEQQPRRHKKPSCRDQLAECKAKLDECMKIVRWQTVDGASYAPVASATRTPNIQHMPIKLDFSTPMAASTPFTNRNKSEYQNVGNKKTPRPKRQKKAPKRFTPSAFNKK
jgi:hypothetical protein